MGKTATNNITGLLQVARQTLRHSSENTLLEAQVLLACVLEKPRSWVIAHPETCLDPDQTTAFLDHLKRLSSGFPLAYLTGIQEFYTLPFLVSPQVLIPRPETELLVEHALSWLKKQPATPNAVDVGTGSGCIAAALARKFPHAAITAVDVSTAALKLAVENFKRLGVSHQIRTACGNLLTAFSGPFQLVCANLPYIPSEDLDSLSVARYEPRAALDGGKNGLDAIDALLSDAPRWFIKPGLMLLEIEQRQAVAVQALTKHYLPGAEVSVIQDLSGSPRLVRIEKN